MDIVDYLKYLPAVAQENDLPLEALPEGFTFVQHSLRKHSLSGFLL